MSDHGFRFKSIIMVGVFFALLWAAAGTPFARPVQESQEEDQVRKIWDDGLVGKRKGMPTGRRKTKFRRVSPVLPPAGRIPGASGGRRRGASEEDAVVGVTVWRLRQSAASDEVRELIHTAPKGQSEPESLSLTPERMEAGTHLNRGERVRISIESSRVGRLYVINREQYADGTLGTPRLIFPTERTRGGDNRVRPGRLITIPAPTDDPSYFTVNPNPRRRDQVAEVLIIIITNTPLALPLQPDASTLPVARVNEWQQLWGAFTERLEQEGSVGMPITAVEAAAGNDEKRELTQGDPAPQTIFHLRVKQGRPLLLDVALPFRR